MNLRLTILLGSLALTACAYPPPLLIPPPPQATGLTCSPSPDPSVISYNFYRALPTDTNWTIAYTSASTNAPGVLVGVANGSIWCVTCSNSVAESDPSNIVTNNIATKPLPAGPLKTH